MRPPTWAELYPPEVAHCWLCHGHALFSARETFALPTGGSLIQVRHWCAECRELNFGPTGEDERDQMAAILEQV